MALLTSDAATSIQIEDKYPGINGIGVIYAVPDAQKAAFLKRQQLDRTEFGIHPVRESDEYWPIAFIVPLAGNEQALGLDIGFELNRVTAANRARERIWRSRFRSHRGRGLWHDRGGGTTARRTGARSALASLRQLRWRYGSRGWFTVC